jgi:hypothetical protein
MSKNLLALALVLLFAGTLSAQHKRRVLVEEFTNASCPPCASQNPGFNTVLNSRADKVTPIKYQTDFPGVDPMNAHNPTEVGTRWDFYSFTGVPSTALNGVSASNDCGAYDGAPACVAATELDAEYDLLTPVTINVQHSLSADFSEINVTVTVTSDEALSGNLRLHVAAVEPEIVFSTAPGTNGEKEFYDVMKKMLPNADGTETGDFTAGESKTYSFSWKPTYYYDLNQVAVIAFLQSNDSGEVYQSERSDPNTVVTGENATRLTLSANNANKLICESNLSPAFTLRNVSTDTLTLVNIQYALGSNAPQSYQWTGSLNPNATTPVTLPAVSVVNSGPNKLVIRATDTNFGIQINQVNGTANANINAMLEVSPAPFTEGFEGFDEYPSNYGLKNDEGIGWFLSDLAGGNGESDKAIVCNFYALAAGKTVETYLPRFNLSDAASAKLTFDHAHAGYSATDKDDRLRVDLSKDCGATWTTVFDKTGDALSTAPLSSAAFIPTADQWVSNEIDISTFAGQASVLIRLRGTSDYGNLLHIDNISVTSAVGTNNIEGLSGLKLSPNPSAGRSDLQFSLTNAENIRLMVYAIDGTLVQSQDLGLLTSGTQRVALDAASMSNGSYRVALLGASGISQVQWVVVK